MAETSETTELARLRSARVREETDVRMGPALTAAIADLPATPQPPAVPPNRSASMTDHPDDGEWARMALGCPQRHAVQRPDKSSPQWVAWLLACRGLLGTGKLVILCGDRGSGKTQIGTE